MATKGKWNLPPAGQMDKASGVYYQNMTMKQSPLRSYPVHTAYPLHWVPVSPTNKPPLPPERFQRASRRPWVVALVPPSRSIPR